MTLRVVEPGLQTTIQGRARVGQRHLGVPASGPADALSMALANRLVGNPASAPALETTLTGITFDSDVDTSIAIVGAPARCTVNGAVVEHHQGLAIRRGDRVTIGAAEQGVRTYVAVAGGLVGDDVLGSTSTYLTAGFGGYDGRALRRDDVLALAAPDFVAPPLSTPAEFRPRISGAWALRAGWSAETEYVEKHDALFDTRFTVASRSDRMGVKLDGPLFTTSVGGQMASVPVFPGTVQCPSDGSLYILSVDSGTTGGYPRVAKITRADLHMLGQLRPGNALTFLYRSDEDASRELREKHAYWAAWLPDVASVI